jgi:mono/diheme cytochrome c family protein
VGSGRSSIRLRFSVAVVLIGWCAGAAAQDQAAIEAGEQTYEENCAQCHGEKLRASGAAFDLRTLGADDRARFDKVLTDGKGQMPSWRGTLSDKEIDEVWAYIRSRAR